MTRSLSITIRVLLSVIILFVLPLFVHAADVPSSESNNISRQILAKFKAGMDRSAVTSHITGKGMHIDEYLTDIDTYRITIPEGVTVEDMLEILRKDPDCEYAEPNQIGGGGEVTVNDPSFIEQWYLQNIGQTGGTPGADIDATEGWSVTTGKKSIVVAILDTGIVAQHPEFEGRVLAGINLINDDNTHEADHPHGVAVAGILAANSNNGLSVAGIDPTVSILPVKVLDENKIGNVSALAKGLIFAANEGAHVINMSLINYPLSPTLINALQYARATGAILVACAGNGGEGNADVSMPGASPLTISVGATDHNDELAWGSATGKALDLVAPGSNIRTVGVGDGQYEIFSGCSAATPMVSAATSLLLSLDLTFSQQNIIDFISLASDDKVGPADQDSNGRDDYFGHGRLNLNKVLKLGAKRADFRRKMRGTQADLWGRWVGLQRLQCDADSVNGSCRMEGTVMLKNRGYDMSQNSEVAIYLSTDPVLEEGVDHLLETATIETLSAGQRKVMKLSAQLDRDIDTAGKYLIAVLDSVDQVDESDETNNTILSKQLK